MAQSQEDYYKIGNGLIGMLSVIGFGAVIQFKMKKTVKRVGEIFQRNARHACSHHSKTKIPFNGKGFPVFDLVKVCDLKIEGDLKSMRADTHKRLATQKLMDMIERREFDASGFNVRDEAVILSFLQFFAS